METKFHSNGKLLLTGEYVVLDGAKALAVPTKFGQSLELFPVEKNEIHWKSLEENNKVWFEEKFQLPLEKNQKFKNPVANRLLQILTEADRLNPKCLKKGGFEVRTKTEFPQNWGLGSSSTLLNNIAAWFGIDAYRLLADTFGGSGYDIACAKTNRPISYQLGKKSRAVSTENFNPNFKDELFFVHLNRKQDSREAIARYRNQPKNRLSEAIAQISAITEEVISCQDSAKFSALLTEHEQIVSALIDQKTIKNRLFPDYPNAIKSLGGWGGDFILAIGQEKEKAYFRKKGFTTILDYGEML